MTKILKMIKIGENTWVREDYIENLLKGTKRNMLERILKDLKKSRQILNIREYKDKLIEKYEKMLKEVKNGIQREKTS